MRAATNKITQTLIKRIRHKMTYRENFIETCTEKFGDRFDYSEVKNFHSNSKEVILCHKHGEFSMQLRSHSRSKYGCKQCSIEARTCTFSDFVKKAREVHSDKYTYNSESYVNSRGKVSISCPIHGYFNQSVNQHLQGGGCPKCRRENSYISDSDAISRFRGVHGDIYDYSLITGDQGMGSKYPILCREHGVFRQLGHDHYHGAGCPQCYTDRRKSNTEDFIRRARKEYEDKYDYSQVEYTNSYSKVDIICPIHGQFSIKPNAFLSSTIGCPHCGNQRSGLYTIANVKRNFDSFKDEIAFAYIIYLSLDGEYYLKVGYSNDVERRVSEIRNKCDVTGYEVLLESDPLSCLILEDKIKKSLTRETDFSVKFGGYTECYPKSRRNILKLSEHTSELSSCLGKSYMRRDNGT